MSSSKLRPKWWQLYLTFPLLIVLFVVDSRLRISSRGHQVVQIAIVLLVFGLIHLWIRANSSALSRMDQQEHYGRITVVQIPLYSLSEIKGVLNDTFEMDYSEMQSVRTYKVSNELEKEYK